MWKAFHEAEKSFVKAQRHVPGYNAIKGRFVYCQKVFDRELKRTKRSYERTKVFRLNKLIRKIPLSYDWRGTITYAILHG